MPSFYLIKQPERQTGRWRIATDSGNLVDVRVPIHNNFTNNPELEGDGTEHRAPFVFIENSTQERAEQLAATFASRTHGFSWFVLQVLSGYVTRPTPPVKLEVSERGVLPA